MVVNKCKTEYFYKILHLDQIKRHLVHENI